MIYDIDYINLDFFFLHVAEPYVRMTALQRSMHLH